MKFQNIAHLLPSTALLKKLKFHCCTVLQAALLAAWVVMPGLLCPQHLNAQDEPAQDEDVQSESAEAQQESVQEEAADGEEVPAPSMFELKVTANDSFEAADQLLNKTYAKLIATLSTEDKKKLKEAQRAWIVYRDSTAQTFAALQVGGGSMEALIQITIMEEITRERAKALDDLYQAIKGEWR